METGLLRVQGATRKWASSILIVLCLALLSAETSYNAHQVSFEYGIAANQATLAGHADPSEWQNRVLFPLWLQSISWLSHGMLNVGRIWRLARFGAAAIAYLGIFSALFRLTRDRRIALVGLALITYCYLWTTGSAGWELGEDFFDLLFCTLFVLCAIQRNYFWMLLAVMVASANRESALFGGVVWACIAGARNLFSSRGYRDYAFGAVCIGVAAIGVYVLRIWLASTAPLHQGLGIIGTFQHWQALLMPFGGVPIIVGMTFPLYWIACQIKAPLPKEAIGLFWAALICGVITATFGAWEEVRIWLPCADFAVMGISIALANRGEIARV